MDTTEKKIMVVDDNEDLIYSVKRSLGDIAPKYSFIEANGGKKCISILEDGAKPDVILLDIMMPGMDGWETAAQIKSNSTWRNIPIIFLTAKTDDLSKNMGKLTAEDYIEKPFDIYDLKERIEKVLQSNN